MNRSASSPALRAPSPPLRAEERDGERRCRSGSWKEDFKRARQFDGTSPTLPTTHQRLFWREGTLSAELTTLNRLRAGGSLARRAVIRLPTAYPAARRRTKG